MYFQQLFFSALIYFFIKSFFLFFYLKKKELPKWLEKLEKHLPMTIMAVLIVYCLKDLKMQLTTLFIPYLLACLTVVFTYKWKNNTFFKYYFINSCLHDFYPSIVC